MTRVTSQPAPPAADNTPPRCLTIDVEEYFHIEAAHGRIPRSAWNDWPSRVQGNIDLLLQLLNRHNCRATFFILGDVARRTPLLAPRIAAAGHEIASHGTNHDRLHRLDPASFAEDLRTSKHLLEDQTGQSVIGYRAPTFSVTPDTAWALDVLIEQGFAYDSSIFPVYHPAYGVPSAPAAPYRVRGSEGGGTLLEVPPLTWRVGRKKLAVAGGGYFRLLPLWFMKRGLAQARRQHRPAVLYFHPWEFDPETPRMPLSRTGHIRTYTGLRSAAGKLESILRSPGGWTTMRDAIDDFRTMAEHRDPFDLYRAT